MARITIVGAGYVGLVTAAGLASLGHRVACVDTDDDKITTLQRGGLPIYEAGLGDLIAEAAAASPSRIAFQNQHDEHSLASEFYFICVPTPNAPDGSVDLSFLQGAAAQLAERLPADAIVVNKSTVPVGSFDVVQQALGRSDVAVVSNPEFLREGSAVHDFLHPDRIVIGSANPETGQRVAALYEGIDTTFVMTDPASAELIKYASNAFLATKLSFVNSIAAICEGINADVADVRTGMGLDRRIGLDFLSPGPGWGGSCFPKDTAAMLGIAEQAGHEFAVVRAAIESNDAQFDRMATKVLSLVDGPQRESKIALLGLAFKAGTDDTRMSPSLAIAERLVGAGAAVAVYDPHAQAGVGVEVTEVGSAIEACKDADVVFVATEWPEFGRLDWVGLADVMRGAAVVDGRGIVDRDAAHAAGLRVMQIGRS